MKNKIIIISTVVFICLIIGYTLGSIFPISKLFTPATNPSVVQTADTTNKGVLKVTVLNSDNKPMVGIEVDVATQPGPPQSWGIIEADTSGVAGYNLDAGDYYIYFNTNRFPSGYQIPVEQKVTVKVGETKEVVIILKAG